MLLKVIWWVCIFIIVEAMIGYPVSLKVIDKLIRKKENEKDYSRQPNVTIMIVAHNEERVIYEKLNNIISVNYPKEKMTIIVTSDYSTDSTCEIVEKFIFEHKDWDIKLHKTREHLGKTNAQNEAQELVETEILIMTDANAMFEENAVKELVASFITEDISYVSGQLRYVNSDSNATASSEGFYWKIDLMCREIESKFQSITAGNGAIYACRNQDYVKLDPKSCHDSNFPLRFTLGGKRAIYNKAAVAYEKAGEVDSDEYKRKVRMNRHILQVILPDVRLLNIFKNRWFSYFYFGHRTCRYLLWLMHLIVLIVNLLLLHEGAYWVFIFMLQALFYMVALLGWIVKSKNRWVRIVAYYCMTIVAQWNGVINIITGKTRATWEKAESTR